MDILEKIIAHKRQEVSDASGKIAAGQLEKSILFNRETISLSESLLESSKTGIIAEFKRKSPSKGIINQEASIVDVASGYFREGASGISILTDNSFFGGYPGDLSLVRENSLSPILRKDFIISEYQVLESKAIGADAILLIAAVLDKAEIIHLARMAQSLGMEVLLEVHEPGELDMLNHHVNIVGVNNRNLKTFKVNTNISEEIADKIPDGFVRISESGISSPHVIKRLRFAGYNGFLIGECFMSRSDPVQAFSEFVKEISQ